MENYIAVEESKVMDLGLDRTATWSKIGTNVRTATTVEEVLKLVQDNLVKCGKKAEDAYVVPTKSGHHIITEPFDLQKAMKQCNMFYEGEQKKLVGYKDIGPGEYDDIIKSVVGWLHKDGMSLLYYNGETK